MDEFFTLRERIFSLIDRAIEQDGHHKSYEGAMSLHFPNRFEPELGISLELNCYVLGPTRHYEWFGATISECVSKATACIVSWEAWMDWREKYGDMENPPVPAPEELDSESRFADALIAELERENERLRAALQDLSAFVSVVHGRGPECVIPETVTGRNGIPVKLGEIMRDAKAALRGAE